MRGHSGSKSAGTERPCGAGTGLGIEKAVGLAERRQGMGEEVTVWGRAEL